MINMLNALLKMALGAYFVDATTTYITLEFSNSSGADCRIYANEGVVQLLFFEGEQCAVSYNDRAGKYQGQSQEVTLAKV